MNEFRDLSSFYAGAYAGSWTPDKVKPCNPQQFGGYPKEKTIYNNSTLRVFNMLVETSDVKEPKSFLGSSLDVLNRDTKGNGHVSRNMRLALLAADLVEPYVGVVAVNKLALADDIVPMTERDSTSCRDVKAVMVARNAETVHIEWTVGGAMSIDSTELWYAKWDDVPGEDQCWTQPDSTDFLNRVGGAVSGTGFFSTEGSSPSPEGSATGTRVANGPLFRASVNLKDFKQGDRILIMASARVDQSWKDQPENIRPAVPPQSHMANVRTNPNYHHESNGKHIKGRLDWFSVPLTVVIGDFKDGVGKRGDDVVNVVEMNSRFVNDKAITKGGMKPKPGNIDQLWFPVALWKYLVVILLVVFFSSCCFRCLCSRRTHRRVKSQDGVAFVASDDLRFEQNAYSDETDNEYGDDEYSDDGFEIPKLS